jgi:mannobiose 2-epimerase
MKHTLDRDRGGFYGAVLCDGTVDKEAPRGAVLNARILWTFSAAARRFPDDVDNGCTSATRRTRGDEGIRPAGEPSRYRQTADHAYTYLIERFRDHKHGGVYWMLDAAGSPISDRKQTYAQAFALYALAEYFRVSGNETSLNTARQLYALIEEHSRDFENGGYLEARARDWSALDDLRLSEKDLNCPKSMNTHLHVMEAYTNLLRVWRDPSIEASQRELLNVTMDRIIDGTAGHFRMFFDRQWKSLSDHVSFGHDIEGSWLLVEAAEVLGDPALEERARRVALEMARAVYEQARDQDGSLFYEADSRGTLVDPNKHWWAQAEGVVGFYNAYQLSGNSHYRDASQRLWQYIKQRVVDRAHGEWHAKLKPAGEPFTAAEDADACLAGPWKCPYHNCRACLEMIERLAKPSLAESL